MRLDFFWKDNAMSKLKKHSTFPFSPDCQRFNTLLAEIPEGEVSPWLAEHARKCPPCSVLLSDLKLILAESRNLPDFDPPATLWPRIHEQLMAEGFIPEKTKKLSRWMGFLRGPFFTPGYRGAMASLVVLAGLLVLVSGADWWGRGPERGNSKDTHVIQASIVPVLAVMEETYRSEAVALPADVTSISEICMTTLSEAIEECERIVQEEPDNALAQDHLMLAYEQKAALLLMSLQLSATHNAP